MHCLNVYFLQYSDAFQKELKWPTGMQITETNLKQL